MNEFLKKIFSKKEKSNTVPKKHYILLQIEFFMLFMLLLGIVYTNYDYFVFKIMMVFSYSYTDTYDRIYEKELKVQDKGNYAKYFDDLAIKSVMDKLKDVGNDQFSFLYTPDEYNMLRENLIEEPVTAEKISDDTVIIRLPSFVPDNIADFKEKMKEIKCSNIVIDLTNNPGGYVDGAVELADLFLDKNMVVYSEKSRNILYNRTFYAKNEKQYDFDNIYIFQNEYTASASEILINALKENLDNVTLIGSKTYGKGIGQFEYNLKYGYVVKATCVQFYSPNGNCINGIGIDADVKCSDGNWRKCLLRESRKIQ